MKKAISVIVWLAVALLGGTAYAIITLHRGEQLNAVWMLLAALCTYAIGYRFYSKWIAAKVMALNDLRATPCEVHEDGHDFVKTNKWIVFGHHFAAISGPGPLVGPVLAAQFGYLPGTLWIMIGVVLGGAVQDFIILCFSMRRDGKSLGQMIKEEVNSLAGILAMIGILSIMIILLAVLALVVVRALAESPWGTFTIAATIPIAIFMGFYLRFLRPGKVLEITVLGITMLLLAVWGGKFFHEVPALAKIMTWSKENLAWAIIAYGLAASILPVWMLLAPRDYLSTFMKLGTVALLALGIIIVLPPLQMPPLSRFIDGTGPVVAGSIFPFCFITIACGAISGFHSLIASGTTPKLITRETFARPIGYGAMLLESFVAIMAMIAATTMEPGVYFAINSPQSLVGAPDAAVQKISGWGFPVTVDEMNKLAQNIGEKNMFDRPGGAPTLAVGMAHIFSKILGGDDLMGLWYHFAIMFEALFILTTIDAGTRVGRFMLQDFLGHVWKPLGHTKGYFSNVFASVLFVSGWGYFLYQGVIDPLGGVNSLWPLFGIANQLLAVIALCLATTVLIKMGKTRCLFVTLIPLLWLLTVTFTAAAEKVFHANVRIGFLAAADHFTNLLAAGKIAAHNVATTERIIFNFRLDAVVTGVYVLLVGAIVAATVWRWIMMWWGNAPKNLHETPPVWRTADSENTSSKPSGWGWLWAVVLMGLSLLRNLIGEDQFARARANAPSACCHDGSAKSDGQLWAEHEERRLHRPRCC